MSLRGKEPVKRWSCGAVHSSARFNTTKNEENRAYVAPSCAHFVPHRRQRFRVSRQQGDAVLRCKRASEGGTSPRTGTKDHSKRRSHSEEEMSERERATKVGFHVDSCFVTATRSSCKRTLAQHADAHPCSAVHPTGALRLRVGRTGLLQGARRFAFRERQGDQEELYASFPSALYPLLKLTVPLARRSGAFDASSLPSKRRADLPIPFLHQKLSKQYRALSLVPYRPVLRAHLFPHVLRPRQERLGRSQTQVSRGLPRLRGPQRSREAQDVRALRRGRVEAARRRRRAWKRPLRHVPVAVWLRAAGRTEGSEHASGDRGGLEVDV
jgi:hypothetical protein